MMMSVHIQHELYKRSYLGPTGISLIPERFNRIQLHLGAVDPENSLISERMTRKQLHFGADDSETA
jgi:hypothetical protein